MRLLNTSSLELHEFFESETPEYAILSHRWESGEVSFKDVTKKRNLEAAGWTKIRKCCEFAWVRKRKWVWIDTCCIDKRSSAELSEAINSMYRWYQNAIECYAYLTDVLCGDEDVEFVASDRVSAGGRTMRAEVELSFRESEWFRRGWTLQELLAPIRLYFVDSEWRGIIGSRWRLRALINDIAGIDPKHFDYETSESPDSDLSVAKKMSWAARRKCTRQEDIAYCLLGIFQVNMPLLYGEGRHAAFRRLQLEILKESNDESIFAWDCLESSPGSEQLLFSNKILAPLPLNFASSSNIRCFQAHEWSSRAPYWMTNRGLALQTVISKPTYLGKGHYRCLVPLRCYREGFVSGANVPLAVAVSGQGTQETQDYVRQDELPGGKLFGCPRSLIDWKRKRFVGKERLIYLWA
jgi:hypothetical protein